MASKGRASPPATAPKARTESPKARGTDKDKEQSERFKQTARELEADESGKAFESIAAKTQESYLLISVTSLTTRSRIDFILRWTGPIGICLAV